MSEGDYENTDGFEDEEPDAMKNTDIDGQLYANIRVFKPRPRDGVVASVHVQWWKRPSGVAAVCLGLLCVLLLAGIIGLSVYYRVIGHHDSTEREELQDVNSLLTEERDQLQTRYNNLTKERDQLHTRYNNLTKERDQLQTSYNNLTEERDQLQTERDFLNGRFTNLRNSRLHLVEQTCPEGWQKFESSWYFLSTETKTWNESRKDCLERGADLVIINSNKEQEFLFNLNKGVWIGLTDSVTEGNLIWVDGTPLTTPRYWHQPQPDNGAGRLDYGEEDCVEIRKDQRPLEAWNDLSCDREIYWVCEKVV
ncbi:CD209 antigen-like protein C isoform X1 [Salvelinus alpinus]|uniref:CD209 antigen-like protein C isoform X1 n=1 Tax=Salvelinus alpinus TaxID=8036 RepID=UPI0039FCD4B7